MPTKKSVKHQPIQTKSDFGKPKTFGSWLWKTLIAVITLAGGWTIVRPDVHVEPYLQLDPESPFSERFKVSNNGNFAVHNVEVYCHIMDAHTLRNFRFDHSSIRNRPNYRKVIEAGDSTTIDCPVEKIVGLNGDRYISAEIQFQVSFRPSWYPWRKQREVKFSGQLDSQGNVQWVYAGS